MKGKNSLHFYQWVEGKGYFQGVFWMILACIFSNLNDTLVKQLGSRLSGVEIAFLRFFFSSIVLLPFMVAGGIKSFKTYHPWVHFIRAALLIAAVAPWCYGITVLPLALCTTIGFTTPLFAFPMALAFLRERSTLQCWLATTVGFFGIVIALNPFNGIEQPFAFSAALLILSTVIFASLDIINKKLLIQNESILPMLFFSAVGTAALGFLPATFDWKTPLALEMFLLLLLGIGANLVLYCLLKAFNNSEISSIQPFRYTELVFSIILGYFIFGEAPTWHMLLGASIIIVTTLYISCVEARKKNPHSITENEAALV